MIRCDMIKMFDLYNGPIEHECSTGNNHTSGETLRAKEVSCAPSHTAGQGLIVSFLICHLRTLCMVFCDSSIFSSLETKVSFVCLIHLRWGDMPV
jgi:hypothetical protein